MYAFFILQCAVFGRKSKQKTVKTENEKKSFVQTWQNNTITENHDPIGRVQAILEQKKKIDETQRYLKSGHMYTDRDTLLHPWWKFL